MIENLPDFSLGTLGLTAGMTATVALVASSWQQIRSFISRINSIFVSRVYVESSLSAPVIHYLNTNYRKSSLDVVGVSRSVRYIKSLSRRQEVGIVYPMGTSVYWEGFIPIIVTQKESEGNSSVRNGITLGCLRGLVDLKELVALTFDEENNRNHLKSKDKRERFYVQTYYGAYGSNERSKPNADSSDEKLEESSSENHLFKYLRYSAEDMGEPIPDSPFEDLYYSEEVDFFIRELEQWFDNEEWFKTRGVPWRLGALLQGPAGTGKSSLVKAIAQMLGIPIYIFDLPSMGNEELIKFWKYAQNNSPCIILFEDLDRVFDGRELLIDQSMSGKGQLTLDALLNCISGVQDSQGILTIITVNDPDKLDSALCRGGRLDRTLTIDLMQEKGLRLLAQRIINGDVKDTESHKDIIDELVSRYPDGCAGGNFMNLCTERSLKLYWEEVHNATT